MALLYLKNNTIFLHVLVLLILTSISCHAAHGSQTIARKVQEIYPEPGVECDTCTPCDTCPEPIPPPPPPPVVECPPPPPPPCPPPPPPPEEPCEPCEAKSPPPPQTWPPKGYYNPSGSNNLYETEYGYSSGARVSMGFVGVLMVFVLPLLQMIG